MPTTVVITDHARKRIKKRMGLNRKAAYRVVDIALKKGICRNDTKGQLLKFMELRDKSYEIEGKRVIIYGEMVYCFVDKNNVSILITVYRIPNNLRNHATYQSKRTDIA